MKAAGHPPEELVVLGDDVIVDTTKTDAKAVGRLTETVERHLQEVKTRSLAIDSTSPELGSELSHPTRFFVRFSASEGSFEGAETNSSIIESDGDALTLTWERACAIPEDEEVSLQPGRDDWRRFWEALDRYRVWDWDHSYEPALSDVGGRSVEWEIDIQHMGRQLRASGYADAFPTDDPDDLRASATDFSEFDALEFGKSWEGGRQQPSVPAHVHRAMPSALGASRESRVHAVGVEVGGRTMLTRSGPDGADDRRLGRPGNGIDAARAYGIGSGNRSSWVLVGA